MGPTDEPERPDDTPEVLHFEPERLPVGLPAVPPAIAPPRAPAPPAPVAPRAAPRSALWWLAISVLTLGSVGFMAGFIGPIILRPSANQGPLLGIFITGPLGVVLGFVLGIVCAVLFRDRPRAAGTALVLGGVVYAGAVVIVVLLAK